MREGDLRLSVGFISVGDYLLLRAVTATAMGPVARHEAQSDLVYGHVLFIRQWGGIYVTDTRV